MVLIADPGKKGKVQAKKHNVFCPSLRFCSEGEGASGELRDRRACGKTETTSTAGWRKKRRSMTFLPSQELAQDPNQVAPMAKEKRSYRAGTRKIYCKTL